MHEKQTQEKKTWITPEVDFDEVKNVEGGNRPGYCEDSFYRT